MATPRVTDGSPYAVAVNFVKLVELAVPTKYGKAVLRTMKSYVKHSYPVTNTLYLYLHYIHNIIIYIHKLRFI